MEGLIWFGMGTIMACFVGVPMMLVGSARTKLMGAIVCLPFILFMSVVVFAL